MSDSSRMASLCARLTVGNCTQAILEGGGALQEAPRRRNLATRSPRGVAENWGKGNDAVERRRTREDVA